MCVVVADTARARLFLLARTGSLVETEDLVNPERRRRDSEILTDPRPGLYQAQRGGPRHAFDDHRDRRRAAEDRGFAGEVVEHVASLSERLGRCPITIVASPPMLGALRAILDASPGWLRRQTAQQLGRDVTTLTPARLHDWLAARGLLPPRRRPGVAA
jgi:hypothetical protein